MGLMLNLASGTDIKPKPWINMDIVSWPGVQPPDLYWDARKDKIPFPDGSVSVVYAGYLLLHLAPAHHEPVLSDIYRVLEPGGTFLCGEVDFDVVLPRWMANPDDRQLSELIWGEQGERAHGTEYADYDKHCWGYNWSKLTRTLERFGFRDMRRVWIHRQPDVFYEMTAECKK